MSIKKHYKCDRVTIDPGLSLDKHISKVCSSCALHTKALRHIRLLLDVHTANAIACSLIYWFSSSRLLQSIAC